MIRTLWLSPDARLQRGTGELVEQWRSAGGNLWIDLEGESNDALQSVLQELGCDELAIKDCLRPRHPPKVEYFGEQTFVLFRGIAHLDDSLELTAQQIALWVGRDYIITVRRGHSVSLDHYWQHGDVPQLLSTPGSLALRILEYASGRYLEHMLAFEGRLEELEDSILSDHSETAMKELVQYRGRLRKLRRILSYHHRLAEEIWRDGSVALGQGEDDTLPQRRNLFDRCERVYSLCAMFYEISGDLIEGYISLSSHRLNSTMKILTIITAVFVPLGFIAGLYGMNFAYMPELAWRPGYFVVLGVMALIATSMLVVFKRSKWL